MEEKSINIFEHHYFFQRRYMSHSQAKEGLAARRKHRLGLRPSLSVDHNCSKILPHLYLGGHEMTTEADTLKTLNITHILSITVDSYNHFPTQFSYQQFPLLDSAEADIVSIFEPAFAFIESARAQGAACLVHCSFGMSRSPSVVLGYLMYSEKMSLAQAMIHVKGQRPVTAPNHGFMHQLVVYEEQLCGTRSVDVEKYRANRCASPSEFIINNVDKNKTSFK